MTVCWVLHDLNQAAAYSDEVLVMANGRSVATGPPDEVLTQDLIRDIFDVETVRLSHPLSGRAITVPARFPGRSSELRETS